MINLYVLDKQLNKIAMIDTYKHFSWINRYSDVGEFKLIIPFSSDLSSILIKDNFILNPVENEIAVIEVISIKKEEFTTLLEIQGRFSYSLAERRINNTTKNYSNTPVGAVIADLYNSNLLGNTNRGISILKPLESTTGANISIQDSYSNILEKTLELAKANGLGIKGEYVEAEKKIKHSVYMGRDLSKSLVFSSKYENVLGEDFFYNSKEHKTFAYIGGEGEGTARIFTTTGEGQGLDLKEVFIDAKDLRKEELTEQQYKDILTTRGKEKLSNMLEVKTFNSGIATASNIKYRYNYQVGDKVKYISNELGIETVLTIEEVEEVFEKGSYKINIGFGDDMPKLSQLIKNMIGGK